MQSFPPGTQRPVAPEAAVHVSCFSDVLATQQSADGYGAVVVLWGAGDVGDAGGRKGREGWEICDESGVVAVVEKCILVGCRHGLLCVEVETRERDRRAER